MKLTSLSENEPTQKMIDFYEKRTKEHIDRVIDNMSKIAANSDYEGLEERGKEHDSSKYGKEERIPYIWLTEFYRCKNEGEKFTYPPGVKEKVDRACEHHVNSNRHHPEAHENIEDMTDIDIIEMVCDWTAMSQELNQDGGSAKGWADKNVGTKWKFTDDQKDLIYKTIKILDGE